MALRLIKDLYKYKQSPYFDKLCKQDRKQLGKAYRHWVKGLISNKEVMIW